MPPDKENVATAEQEAETLLPEEPAPGAEEEPSEPDETPEEGAPDATEDEGKGEEAPPDLKAQLLQALKGVDPEVLKEALPPEELERLRGPEPQVPTGEADLSGLHSLGRINQAQSDFANTDAYARRQLNVAYETFRQSVEAQAKAVTENKAESITVDPAGLQRAIADWQQALGYGADRFAKSFYAEQARIAVEGHPAYRLLTPEERSQVEGLWQDAGQMQQAVRKVLDVALQRGAPEEAKKQAKAELDRDGKLAASLERILSLTGGNGAKSVEAGSARGVRIANFDDAEQAWIDGKISDEQYRKYREQYKVPSTAR